MLIDCVSVVVTSKTIIVINLYNIYLSQFDPIGTLATTRLTYDKVSHKFTEQKMVSKQGTSRTVQGLLGVIKIAGRRFILLVDESQEVNAMYQFPIQKIKKVSYLSAEYQENETIIDDSTLNQLNHLIFYFQDKPFYFSYYFDLLSQNDSTIPAIQTVEKTQKQRESSIKALIDPLAQFKSISGGMSPINKGSQGRNFWWNLGLLKPLRRAGISEGWQLRLIQGYVGGFSSTLVSGKVIQYLLVSRRSWGRGSSTLHESSGATPDGQVANFVESEQFMFLENGILCSFRMVRGSAPLIYKRGFLEKNFSIPNDETQKKTFLKHMHSLNQAYGRVECLDLMNNKISQTYEKLAIENKLDFFNYSNIDFDEITKNYKYTPINNYISTLIPQIHEFGFTQFDLKTGIHKSLQKGIFRVNCIDCMFRTDIFMSILALQICQEILEIQGEETKAEFQKQLSLNENDFHSQVTISKFKYLWAQNTHNMNKCYLPLKLSEILKKTSGIVKDFNDSFIQDGQVNSIINIMLRLPPIIDASETLKIVNHCMKLRSQEFSERKKISIFVLTWNIGAQTPLHPTIYAKLFSTEGQLPPDVIVVAFQEVVELNAKNVLNNNNNAQQVEQWRNTVEIGVRSMIGDHYSTVASSEMVGCLLIVLCKHELQGKVVGAETSAIKQGFGKLGNKGAVTVTLRLFGSLCCFVNVHLPAGHGKKSQEARVNAIEGINVQAFQPLHDGEALAWVVLTGDTNFRVNISYSTAIEKLNEYAKNPSQQIPLMEYDQLAFEKTKYGFLSFFREAPITFLPTYKFDLGTHNYDTSKKQRVPSWTDRVLFASPISGHQFDPIFYDSLYESFTMFSDHRPVRSYFITTVDVPQENIKEKVFKQILRQAAETEVKILSGVLFSQRYFDKDFVIKQSNQYSDQNLKIGGRRPIPDLESLTDPANYN